MKSILMFWGAPLAMLGLWYGLSYYDINFGFFMLRREFHDLVFQTYGDVLGLAPEVIPPLVAKAIVLDTAVVFCLVGLRNHRAIAAWWRDRRLSAIAAQPRASKDSLSNAP